MSLIVTVAMRCVTKQRQSDRSTLPGRVEGRVRARVTVQRSAAPFLTLILNLRPGRGPRTISAVLNAYYGPFATNLSVRPFIRPSVRRSDAAIPVSRVSVSYASGDA